MTIDVIRPSNRACSTVLSLPLHETIDLTHEVYPLTKLRLSRRAYTYLTDGMPRQTLGTLISTFRDFQYFCDPGL